MSTQLPALTERRFEMTQIHDMAKAIAHSGLFGIKTPEQAFALMLIADAEGEHPATVAQDYDIIQGRPARKSHSVLARFQAAGGVIEWHDLNERIAEATFRHPKGGQVRLAWTIEMAANAKLSGKDNWKAYPRAMLRARCISEGVRTVYPAALGGALMVEEAQDMEPMTIDNDTRPKQPEPPRVGRKPKPADPPVDITHIDNEPRADVQQIIDDTASAPADPPPPAAAPKPAGTGPFVGTGEIAYLRNKAASIGKSIDDVLAKECGGLVLDKMTRDDFNEVKRVLLDMESQGTT